MSQNSRAPLTLPEYERLFRTIHAVVANEKGKPSNASLFFGIAGAYLLSRHHRLKTAHPVVGLAAYNLRTPTNFVLVLGAVENDKLVSNHDHFHCWIEVDGWIVDLTAPLFDSMAPMERKGAIVPPLMFQKPMHAAAGTIESLNVPGAYTHVPNTDLTTTLLARFTEMPGHSRIVQMCDQWYARPPRKMRPALGIADLDGRVKEVRFSQIHLKGSW